MKGRIRIRIIVISWTRIRISIKVMCWIQSGSASIFQMASQSVWEISLFELFFKVLSLYLEARIRIQIRIKVKGRIRIRIRIKVTSRIRICIKVMRIRNSVLKKYRVYAISEGFS